MGNLLRMDLYRMRKGKCFLVCLILTFVLSLGSMPLQKLLISLGNMLSKEQQIEMPVSENLSAIIGSPVTIFVAILVMISVVIFYSADMESGYIKNIAGQMPKRGFSILSRFLATIAHNAVFLFAAVAGNLIGTMLCMKVVADDAIASGVLSFFLKLLLLQSLDAVLLLPSATFRNKSVGMVLAMMFGITAMALLYAAIDSGLQTLFNQPSLSIDPYMPDTLLFQERPDTLRALFSSAVTIGIFLLLAIRIFDKRDVK